jgi:ribosomal protein S18 acetylase RimI-like enzyme
VIRRSVPADYAWIRDLAAEAYEDLGDYGTIIPSWLDHPGVLAYLDACDRTGRRRGFVLLGFYEPSDRSGDYVADLLALAVHSDHRRQGVGRGLLRYAIHVAELAGRHNEVGEIRLTVADGNTAGQRLYLDNGFRVLDEDHGCYDGGQRAIRMSRPLTVGLPAEGVAVMARR